MTKPDAVPPTPNVRPLAGVSLGDLINLCVKQEATNLHIAVGLPPVLRVKGKLFQAPYEAFDAATARRIVFDFLTPEQKRKLEAARDITFTRRTESARMFYASVFYDLGCVAATFSLAGAPPPTFQSLGLPTVLEKLSHLAHGLVLVTGPGGSGQSAVIAAMLDAINRSRPAHIVTVEDQIEYLHQHREATVFQRIIGYDTPDQQTALRSAAKQNADVIAVESLRDLCMMQTVLNLAETRLVFAQIATLSAATTIERFIESFPAEKQGETRYLLSLRLVIVICCQRMPRVYGTGRVAAYEILIRTLAIANLIREKMTSHVVGVIRASGSVGMQTMENALLDLVRAGTISRDTALAHSPNRLDMLARLSAQ